MRLVTTCVHRGGSSPASLVPVTALPLIRIRRPSSVSAQPICLLSTTYKLFTLCRLLLSNRCLQSFHNSQFHFSNTMTVHQITVNMLPNGHSHPFAYIIARTEKDCLKWTQFTTSGPSCNPKNLNSQRDCSVLVRLPTIIRVYAVMTSREM